MTIYNTTGYSLIALHVLAAGWFAPPSWGFAAGAAGGFVYLLFIWFFGGVYLTDVMHLGIAHRALDYRVWFMKFMAMFYNTVGIYINPVTWVNRHRHHHAFSDHAGDPNKLESDGFWRTLWLCLFPYKCEKDLARDEILRTVPFRLVSNPYYAVFSQFASFGLLWLVVRDWKYALVLWWGVRVFALWINLVKTTGPTIAVSVPADTMMAMTTR